MRCSRLLIALLIATAFALPRASVPTASAQILHGNGIELYRSEGFGYLFWWDPASWALDERSAEPGFDHVRMSKDQTFVDFFGYAQPGITPRQCVEDVLARLVDNPSIVDVAPLAPGSVTPHIFDINDLASTELVITVDGSEGIFKLATAEICLTLVPGESVLHVSLNISAAGWNIAESFDTEDLLWTLTLPHTAWALIPNDDGSVGTPLGRHNPINATRLFDSAGEEIALLSPQWPCSSDSMVIAAENSGSANFVLDPLAVLFQNNAGQVARGAAATWLYPTMSIDHAAVLHLGEVAILSLVSPFPAEGVNAYYVVEDNVAVPLAFECVSPAGAAPVLIDTE